MDGHAVESARMSGKEVMGESERLYRDTQILPVYNIFMS